MNQPKNENTAPDEYQSPKLTRLIKILKRELKAYKIRRKKHGKYKKKTGMILLGKIKRMPRLTKMKAYKRK